MYYPVNDILGRKCFNDTHVGRSKEIIYVRLYGETYGNGPLRQRERKPAAAT